MEMTPETQQEGRVARAIARRTSQIPSDAFLWGALGVYDEIVKVAGDDGVRTRLG